MNHNMDKKLSLGGWLLVLIAVNYIYRLYLGGIAPHSLSPTKAFIVTGIETVIGISILVLFTYWVFSFIKTKWNKRNNHEVEKLNPTNSWSFIKNKRVLIISSILLLLALSFFWFSYKPYSTRKNCNDFAIMSAIKNTPLGGLDVLLLPIASPTNPKNPDGSINVISKEEIINIRKQKYMYNQALYNKYYTGCLRENGM
ncbi:MAG: hypothetical protein WA051_02145 [Minisyncoccia bacterium]